MNELYETLGVSPDASQDEIKKAYRERAMKTHPDHGGDEEEFKLVSLAGTILTDPAKRKHYDETGSAGNGVQLNPAEEIIAELVNQAWLQREMPPNPIRWMQEQVDCTRTKLRSMIAEHEHKLKKFTDRLSKFSDANQKSKNQVAVRLIGNILRAAIKDQQESIDTCKRNLQYAEDAMVLLNDLKFPEAFGRTSVNGGWSFEAVHRRQFDGGSWG